MKTDLFPDGEPPMPPLSYEPASRDAPVSIRPFGFSD